MVTEFWAAITVLGDIRLWILFLMFAAVYIYIAKGHHTKYYSKRRQKFKTWLWVAFMALVIAGASAEFLKDTLEVPRICDPALNPFCPAGSFAFPSGHTTMAFAMFTVIPLVTKRKEWWLVMVLPVLVGYSRIALGVHVPGDIAAGAVLGIVSALIGYKLYKFGEEKKQAK